MKDNKIDIMCSKLGSMRDTLHGLQGYINSMKIIVDQHVKGIEVLQQDLELLRKCTLDNPDFKWSELK